MTGKCRTTIIGRSEGGKWRTKFGGKCRTGKCRTNSALFEVRRPPQEIRCLVPSTESAKC